MLEVTFYCLMTDLFDLIFDQSMVAVAAEIFCAYLNILLCTAPAAATFSGSLCFLH